MKVSVVIPCYNAEKFAETCLETLLAQTLQDLEFIFVDDGSTDATADILDSFKERDARVRVIHQENKCLG
ncbi:MAG: glycosyltransferase, partial [Bacteroidales bacterium]|nr:glycosyltransferase [Bacteroidales bacterium]